MGWITKIAAVENASVIWEYDPSLPNNCILGGSLDVIAAIRTIAVKVGYPIAIPLNVLSVLSDSSFWTAHRVF
jgi:hypothetical protein